MTSKTFSVTFEYQGVDDVNCDYINKIIDYYLEYGISDKDLEIFNTVVCETIDSQEV